MMYDYEFYISLILMYQVFTVYLHSRETKQPAIDSSRRMARIYACSLCRSAPKKGVMTTWCFAMESPHDQLSNEK